MKRILALAAMSILTLSAAMKAEAQITLDECISLACDNYPQIKEMELIEATRKYDISNAAFAWLPQLNLSGKASWQSEVVEMPFDIPGFEMNIPHDQYGIVADVSQQIWDGGVSANKKKLAQAGADVRKSQLEVNLYPIKSRVENVFLGIILIDRQLDLNKLLEQSLRRSSEEVEALIGSGVAMNSDLDQLSVNLLSCLQQRASLEADRNSYLRVLSLMTGRDMTDTQLEVPEELLSYTDGASRDFDSRPEMALFAAQLNQSKLQLKQLNTFLSPKLSLSLQGGYGRPGMNMLSGDFSGYFVAGLRLQWNIGALYTRGNDKRKIQAEQTRIDLSRESFLLNSSIEAEQKNNAIAKARDVLAKDSEIIALRKRIRETGENQYKEGAIKMNDYLSMLDEEYKAMANESLHEIQLMMAVYDLKNTLGK